TLWTVFVINFLAVGLIWAYVSYTYPKLDAARFWGASSVTAAIGGLAAMLIIVFPDTLLPLLAGGTIMVFAACLAAMGIERFYDRSVSWHSALLITAATFAGLLTFITVWDSMPMRVQI